MPSETTLQRLASVLLGEAVVPWIRAQRAATTCSSCGVTSRKSWRQIADDLREATDGQVDLPFQTLTTWLSDVEDATDEPDAAAPVRESA